MAHCSGPQRSPRHQLQLAWFFILTLMFKGTSWSQAKIGRKSMGPDYHLLSRFLWKIRLCDSGEEREWPKSAANEAAREVRSSSYVNYSTARLWGNVVHSLGLRIPSDDLLYVLNKGSSWFCSNVPSLFVWSPLLDIIHLIPNRRQPPPWIWLYWQFYLMNWLDTFCIRWAKLVGSMPTVDI